MGWATRCKLRNRQAASLVANAVAVPLLAGARTAGRSCKSATSMQRSRSAANVSD